MQACNRWTLAALALIGLACAGCAEDKTARLSGTVTLDGTPIEKGSISLKPVDGNAPTAEAFIVAGKYSLTTLPGAKNVVISGKKKTGTRHYHEEDPTSPMVDIEEEIVPARYNTASQLTADVKAGVQPLDFALTTDSP